MTTTGWCVTVDVGEPGESHHDVDRGGSVVLDRLGELTASLEEVHGVVAGDARGWSATVTVDAADLDTAQTVAVERVVAAARACELPTDPLVRVEVVREDVRDAELERPVLPELVSGPEAAAILGVSKQRVHQLAAAHPNFPTPLYEVAAGKLWARSAIDAFAEQWARRPGRPARQ